MRSNTEIPLQELIQCVEQKLTNENWQNALNIWINNSELLNLIKWLATVIIQSVSSEFIELLKDIISWNVNDDELRRCIYKKAENLGFTTQAGSLGLALFMFGGSMSPPEYEPVYAPPRSVAQILHGILINQSVITSDTSPVEGAKGLFQQWCSCHYQ